MPHAGILQRGQRGAAPGACLAVLGGGDLGQHDAGGQDVLVVDAQVGVQLALDGLAQRLQPRVRLLRPRIQRCLPAEAGQSSGVGRQGGHAGLLNAEAVASKAWASSASRPPAHASNAGRASQACSRHEPCRSGAGHARPTVPQHALRIGTCCHCAGSGSSHDRRLTAGLHATWWKTGVDSRGLTGAS